MAERPSLSTLGLGGCTKVIIASTKGDITLAAMALMSCEEHHGEHHFFVAGEGKMLGCSATAIKCLEKQGVRL